MKRELEQIDVPREHEAREDAWKVVRAAFAEHEPGPHRRSWKPVAAIALAAAVVAGLLSPPGQAVLDEIREVVGVEQAEPALFSLPAPGRLLVTSDSGAWVVDEDGSKRLLGRYREASWSPFGAFVVGARANELVAMEPDGDVRWSLARPDVRFPRWGGSRTDTRIAYLSRGGLRVVNGDGTGDRLLDAGAAARAPVWRTGMRHVLVYARGDGSVRGVQVDTNSVVPLDAAAEELRPRPDPVVRRVLGAARVGKAVRSPDGGWVVVGWPDADQLVFLRAEGRQQIRAVSDISAQFGSRSFPEIEGWCCAG